jgi:hypothetical protein
MLIGSSTALHYMFFILVSKKNSFDLLNNLPADDEERYMWQFIFNTSFDIGDGLCDSLLFSNNPDVFAISRLVNS